MISLLLKLLIAHSIGDFALQPDKWVKDKKKKKHRSKYLYIHILIHAVALLFVLRFDWSYWLLVLTIVITHFTIDLIKLQLDNNNNARILFFIDQIAHLLVIGIVVYIYEPYQLNLKFVYSDSTLILVLSLILTTSVSSIIMKLVMNKWTIKSDTNDSLEQAGKYIGILERLFVFGFIVLNQWQVIGLLIAAKSVFRFSDLSKAKDRKLTEYILIGTLLSFGLAILIGLVYKYAIKTLKMPQ